MDEVEDKVRCPFWIPYGNEHRYDLLYDFKLAQTDIFEWKVHIVLYVNQEITKQDQLKTISTNPNCALVIMDRAMKFLQLKYREKQSDWFGKRGLRWHISTVITRDPNLEGRLELRSYAHMFDACQQDWFAVCSIIESTLKIEKPQITWVYLRSDKVGCYHNNSLIAAARGTGKWIGLEVFRYDFSEPQYGK